MRPASDYNSSCTSVLSFAFICNICAINLALSYTVFLFQEGAFGSISDILEINYLFYGVTALCSLIAVIGIIRSRRFLIFPLFIWDFMRLMYILWIMAEKKSAANSDSSYILFVYIGWLVISVIFESLYLILLTYEQRYNTFLAQLDASQQYTPSSTIIDVPEECGTQYSQSRFYTRCPPRLDDSPPPPYSYSSLVASSKNTSVPAASLFCTNTLAHSAGEVSRDLPPPYEPKPCSGYLRPSLKSDVNFQEHMNSCFSAYVEPLQ